MRLHRVFLWDWTLRAKAALKPAPREVDQMAKENLATSTNSPAQGLRSLAESVESQSGARRTLAKLFLPSISDCFFIALIVWQFMSGTGGWMSLLGDGDTGWHIRTGQYILEHRSVPTTDLFSFSRPGAPWFAWEWLTDVVYAVLFRMGGMKGIVLFAGVMIALYATVLLRYTLWRGANPLVAALTTLFAVGASSLHFLARPHLFTLVLLPVCWWVVEADRRQRTRWLWALIPVTALWTNLHGGFVIWLACLALLVVGCVIEGLRGAERGVQIGRYSALLAGCALASLANPFGIRLQEHIFEYLRADWIKNIVQEFQAPTFRNEGQLQYEALLVAGLVVTGFLLHRRRIVEALLVLFLAHCSLTSVRHAPIYAAVAAPLIACQLTDLWRTQAAKARKSSAGAILYQMGADLAAGFRRTSVWPVVLIVALVLLDAPLQWPHDFPAQIFPIAMIDKHADLVASGRLLTPDQWGDYIIYRFYPRQKVYVDGRSDFYGQKLGEEYLHLLEAEWDWQAIVERNGFDVALLPVGWPLASLLKRNPGWQVVEDDGKVILFHRLRPQMPGN